MNYLEFEFNDDDYDDHDDVGVAAYRTIISFGALYSMPQLISIAETYFGSKDHLRKVNTDPDKTHYAVISLH